MLSADRDLGLDLPITRRDFLNATLLGAGAALLTARAPLEAQAPAGTAPGADWTGPGGVGDYARSNGNTWEVVQAAHALRDGRYTGALAGAADTREAFDLIVVGGGLSGLGAAYFFQKTRGGSCLVLDNHPMVGGEAKRNEFVVDGLRLIGPQGSNGFGTRVSGGWVGEYWKDLGLPSAAELEYQRWAPGVAPLEIPRDHYYFQLWSDEFPSHGFFFPDGAGGLRLVRDAFRTGLSETPWPEPLRRDFLRWRTDPKRYYEGKDVDRWLDSMTYDAYLTKVMGLDPAVARYVDPIMAAAIGLGSDVLSAYAAFQIRLPGLHAFSGPVPSRTLASTLPFLSSFPGGNDGIMRHVLKWLVPECIAGGKRFGDILNRGLRFAALDRAGAPTRIRLGATVLRVEQRGSGQDGAVLVSYERGGRLYRARARGVVMANGGWTSQHLVADLPQSYREAYAEFVRAPMLVVNVALRHWRFMYDLGLTAASYRDRLGFSCNLRQSMVAGDYRPPLDPAKPILLTFYVPFTYAGRPLLEQARTGRTELLGTSFREYERRIKEQLVRLFGRSEFDPRRDVAGVVLNRWGHAYVCPAPGFYFGRDGKPAAPDVIRKPLGRIGFANAELHGHQNWRDATAEGKRAVEQL